MLPPVVWLSNYFTSFCGVRTNQGYLTERKNTFDFCNIPFQPSDPYHYWLPHLAPVTFMMDISRNTCFFKISWEWVYTVHCTIMCHMKGHKIQQTTAKLSCLHSGLVLLVRDAQIQQYSNSCRKVKCSCGSMRTMVWQMRDIHVSLEERMLFGMSHDKVKKRLNKTSLKNAVGLTQAVSIS